LESAVRVPGEVPRRASCKIAAETKATSRWGGVSMHNPTSTEVLRITRTFPAPRERVFAAFTETVLPKQWWGPAGFTLPTASVDLGSGGRDRFVMKPPEGDVMYLFGTFRSGNRPVRAVYTCAWSQETAMDTVAAV